MTSPRSAALSHRLFGILLSVVVGLGAAIAAGRIVVAQGGMWVKLDLPSTGRQIVSAGATAYDRVGHRMLVFGGAGLNGDSDQLWALDLTRNSEQWHQLKPKGVGPRPGRGAATFDTINNRLVLFVGVSPGGVQTWTVDFGDPTGTWKRLDLRPQPVVNGDNPTQDIMAYDERRQRALLLSNRDLAPIEIWALDLRPGSEVWQKLPNCGVGPQSSAGRVHSTLDIVNNRLLVVQSGTADKIWTYSLESGSECWSKVTPAGDAPKELGVPVYDGCSGREQILFFGNTERSDAYAMSVSTAGGETLRLLETAAAQPAAPRFFALQAMDPVNHRLITAYGQNKEFNGSRGAPDPRLDAWALDLGPCAVGTATPSPTTMPTESPEPPTTVTPTATQSPVIATATPDGATVTPTATAVVSATAHPTESPTTLVPTVPSGRYLVHLPFLACDRR